MAIRGRGTVSVLAVLTTAAALLTSAGPAQADDARCSLRANPVPGDFNPVQVRNFCYPRYPTDTLIETAYRGADTWPDDNDALFTLRNPPMHDIRNVSWSDLNEDPYGDEIYTRNLFRMANGNRYILYSNEVHKEFRPHNS
ncbi:hypothetical protein [Acrocarpospora sp. B8E8]|uniref:hypothetical protein n=1 Tax=Acrocarpospora sp. B8E8 TaxID=3153572 RepID=UPI00325F0A55